MPNWSRKRSDFLTGKSGAVQAKIETQMAAAAEALDFESAAMLRDRLRAATFIQGSQAINAGGVGDADVFALAAKGGQIGVQAFFIRGGQNWGHRAFFPSHIQDVSDEEVLARVLAQFYEEVPPPRTILVDRDLPDRALLEEAFAVIAERKVEISVPQRGERRRLMEQAARNATEALDRRLAESGTQARVMRELTEFLELPEVPARIEIYDNSHIQGTKAVGAMVVAGPEGFLKNQYRKFNIRSAQTNDDFAMMREVMARRFGRALEEDPDRDGGTWPDLVLIDGGKGQMSIGARHAGGTGHRGRAADRHRQGPAPWARGARGVPLPRRAREDAAGQFAGAVLSPAAARRGPPLRHRRAPGQAQPGDQRQPARRDSRHRPGAESARCCCTSARPARFGRRASPTCSARPASARAWRRRCTTFITPAGELCTFDRHQCTRPARGRYPLRWFLGGANAIDTAPCSRR